MKKTVGFFEIVFICCIVITAHAGETSVPPLINYQGMLTDADGRPMSGTKKLEFNIYDSAGSGTKIWGPQIFNAVPLISGKFNVILGTTDTAGRSVAEAFGSKDRYLGIKVDSGAELVPRQQILSAPFAIQSEHANLASQADIAQTVQGENLYVDPGTGNVGVGTNSPVEKLEVAGKVKADAYEGNGAALTGIRGCGWEGWKCHCNADKSGTEGRVILGISCQNGLITDFKLVGISISSSNVSCPNAWGNCDEYSFDDGIPEH
jgi:hypothetical protein